MGSFNATCGISGLGISGNDPVKVFLIQKNQFARNQGICNVDSLWVPKSFPIDAKYNDYGTVDSYIEGFKTKIWLKLLDKDLIEKEATDHDPEVKKGMSFEDFLGDMREGRIEVKGHHGEPNDVCFFVARKDVWDYMVKLKVQTTLFNKGQIIKVDGSLLPTYLKIVKDFFDISVDKFKMNKLHKELSIKVNELNEKKMNSESLSLKEQMVEIQYKMIEMEINSDRYISDNLLRIGLKAHFNEVVSEFMLGNITKDEVDKVLVDFAEQLVIWNNMYLIRRIFHPWTTAGEQCTSYDVQSKILKGFAKIAKDKWDSYGYEDE